MIKKLTLSFAFSVSSLIPNLDSSAAILVSETFPSSANAATGYVPGQGLRENPTGFGTGWAGRWLEGTPQGTFITSQNTGVANGTGSNTRTAFRTISPSVALGGVGQVWFSVDLSTSVPTSGTLTSLTFFTGAAGTEGPSVYPGAQERLWMGMNGDKLRIGTGANSNFTVSPNEVYTLTGVIDYDQNKAILWNKSNQAYAYYDPTTGIAQNAVQEIVFTNNDPITGVRIAKTANTSSNFDNIFIAEFGTDLGVVAPEPSVPMLSLMGLSSLLFLRRRK